MPNRRICHRSEADRSLQKLPRKLLVLREGPDLTARFFARHKGRCELSEAKAASLLAPLRGAGGR